MKIYIFLATAVIASFDVFGFSFGELTKAVSDSASAITGNSASDAFLTKQNALISNYALSRQKFATGYSYVAEALGNNKVAEEYASIAKSINVQEKTDVDKIASTTSKLLDGSDSSAIFEGEKTSLKESAKTKYSQGLGQFEESLKLLLQVSKETPELASEAKDIISNAPVADKIKMTNAVEPTIVLGKQVASDVVAMKSKVAQAVATAKEMGITVPSSLSSLLN